ncbi:MAG: YfhO family protein [Carnobacterium sp.]
METQNKKGITRFIFCYLFLFIFMVSVIYGYFFVTRQSFIWEGDGFSQHYLIFKEYLGIIQDFLHQPSAGMAQWNWNIGLGADVIASYGYYIIGDPFVYLGLLFPVSQIELAFHFLILLRVFAIGASFLLFCWEMKIELPGALMGSVIYTFTYYVILNVTRHPFFLLPMIFFPLMCIGVERILRNKSPVFFIGSIFLGAMSNFYFFYMLTILIFLYGLIRFFTLYGKTSFKRVLSTFWVFAYSYFIGVLLSGVLFIPVVWGFLHSSRESSNKFAQGLIVYPLEYYLALVRNLFIPGSYLWTALGFSSFGILVLVYLIHHKQKDKFILIMLTIFGVMLLLPFFGSIMNGLSGPYNRWTFVLPFFLACGSAHLFNDRFLLKRQDLLVMALALFFFSIVTVLSIWVTGYRLADVLPLLFAWIMWVVLLVFYTKKQRKILKEIDKKLYSLLLTLLIMGNLTYNAMDYYYPWGQNNISSLLDYGTVDDAYVSTLGGAEELIQPSKEQNIHRLGVTSKDREIKNQFILLNKMGLSSYLSITNGEVANFARQLENGQFQLIQPIRNGFDDRSIINHLLSVQSIITEEKNKSYLPYGYEVIAKKEEKDRSFVVAKTSLAYPFAYAEETYLPETFFEKMNPVEKEAYLSYGMVLNEKQVQTRELKPFNGKMEVKELAIDIFSSNENKIVINNKKIIVKDTTGEVRIKIKDKKKMYESAVYAYLEGLNFKPLENKELKRVPINYTAIVKFKSQRKSIYQSDLLRFSSYIPRDKMLFHLGYQSKPTEEDTISLLFDQKGSYELADISVLAMPLNQDYQKRVLQKQKQAMNIKTFTNQKISGTVNQEKKTVLTTTIPYTKGWKATVNDKKVETIRVNEGFVGLPLNSGKSTIILTYQTPFLKIGLFASLLGLFLLTIELIKSHKKSIRLKI